MYSIAQHGKQFIIRGANYYTRDISRAEATFEAAVWAVGIVLLGAFFFSISR